MLIQNWDSKNPLSNFRLSGHQYCCDDSITVAPSPSGDGNVLRYILRKTDPDVSSSKRSEVETNNDASETSERWYGLRYWFEKYDVDDAPESIFQFHDQDGSTPPLSIQVNNGRLRLMQSFSDTGNTPYDMGPLTTGKWVNIVLHVRWTTAKTGIIEVWVDGNKLVTKTGIKTNSKGGSYLKVGINKWSWQAATMWSQITTPRIFYIDQFKEGDETSSFSEVSPSASTTPTITLPPTTTTTTTLKPPVTTTTTTTKVPIATTTTTTKAPKSISTVVTDMNLKTVTITFSDGATQVIK